MGGAHDHDHASPGHSHGPEGHSHGRGADRRRLTIALSITATFMVAEFIGGLLSGSLALLSDAAHMASDAAALALSLFALWFAAKPASPERTYGFYRAEILAAFVNAAVLIVLTAWILYEAYQRLFEPQEIQGALMLVVAILGLIANIISARVLHGGQHDNLNMRSAFLHVLGDLLGSAGAIIASLLVLLTGFTLADPIVSGLIGLLILRSAWALLAESINVLLEGAPRGTDVRAIRRTLKGIPGVTDVHDLHVWAISSSQPVLTAHLELDRAADPTRVLRSARTELREHHRLTHVTLQLESDGRACEAEDDLHA